MPQFRFNCLIPVKIDTRLLEIDISEPITQDNYTIRTISKPANVPNVGAGQIFIPPNWPSPNNTKFYTFGGYFPSFNKSLDTYTEPPGNPQGKLFSYDTSSNKWENVSLADGSDQVIWPQEGSSVSIPELGLAFYLGFYQNSSTNSLLGDQENRTYSGFLKVEWDINDPSAPPRWTNDTNLPFNPTIGASLLHVPGIGEKGVLVMFGGYGMLPGKNLPGEWNPLSRVYVYDIAKGTWYYQAASTTAEEFPKNRGYSCYAMIPAKDNSSYNIYMFGGGGRGGGDGTDDMWVLSLPSFTWINFYVQGKFPSVGMSCTLFNNNQILYVGPRVGETRSPCRPLWGVFDVTQSKWVTEFNPQKKGMAPVHPTISKAIGGNGEGKATTKDPKDGWSDEALKELFSLSQRGNTTESDDDSNSSGSTTESDGNSNSKSESSQINRGALIGGLSGGLVALLVLIGWLIQRKRNEKRAHGFGLFGSKKEPKGESPQEMEAPLSMQPSNSQELEGYYRKQPPEGPRSELLAQYPWASREGVRELEGYRSHYELDGGGMGPPVNKEGRTEDQQEQAVGLLRKDHEISPRGASVTTPLPPLYSSPYPETSPSPTSQQWQQQQPRTMAPVKRKPISGTAAAITGSQLKRPSSRFSEDLS